MKPTSKPFVIKMVFSVSFLFLFLLLSQNIYAVSTVTGAVFDKQKNFLPDIEVELLNDYYQMEQRTRTDGAGRYHFEGLRDGRYTIKVYAFRYDLEDQEAPLEINTQSIRSSEGTGYFIQDFYLVPKKGGLKDAELSVIFAQEVPKDAEKAYEAALEDFSKKRDEAGFTNLRKSIELFPNYYRALYRYGMELFMRKQYMDSATVFMKAVEVNPKSATSFYYIGNSFYYAGKNYHKAALKAANVAFTMAPASPPVLLLLGQIERALGMIPEAEKHLLQAKKFSTTKSPEIHKELVQLYANDLKKYKEAADELELYMKASKAEGEESKKLKKQIADLREKAKSQTSN
jgi:TolA-binding protein